jgi:hypothetical protein
MSKRERIYFRVKKGSLVPADSYAASKLRERGYAENDLLAAELVKPRNPKFNRLVHRIGQLVVKNIDAFSGYEPHAAIKRLQLEGNVACDEVAVSMRVAWEQVTAAILRIDGMGVIEAALKVVGSMLPERTVMFMRQPRSLSFATMDEGEYHQAARGICRTIAERYWPDLDEDAIAEMAESFVEEV